MRKINIIPTPNEITYSDTFTPFEIKGAKVVGKMTEGILHALKMAEISESDIPTFSREVHTALQFRPASTRTAVFSVFIRVELPEEPENRVVISIIR